MQRSTLTNDMAGTSDYKWRKVGPEIAPFSGGELDAAPVAYVNYDFGNSGVATQIDNFSDMVGIAALIPVVAILAIIVVRIRSI